jgi:hypothetical protein
MRKRFVSLFLSALLPFTSIPAHAEEKRIVDSLPALVDQVTTPLPEENVGAAISPMRKGNKAMFTGVLLSPLAIATLITELKSAELVTEIEVKRAKDEAAAWCIKDLEKAAATAEAEKKSLQAEIDAKITQMKELEKALDKAERDRPNAYLWAGLGVIGGVGISLLTVYAVSSMSK